MPHEAGHTNKAIVPQVQLPTGVVPNPQSGTSKDTLDLVKKQAVDPKLAQGTAIVPTAQNVNANELLATSGVSATTPTATVPTATAYGATATPPTTAQTIADPSTQAAANYTATTVGTAPTILSCHGHIKMLYVVNRPIFLHAFC